MKISKGPNMDQDSVEILLVEDNPNDAELTLRAFSKSKLANAVLHLQDGAEALDYIFGTGKYSSRDVKKGPKLILLDIKMPKVDGLDVLKKIKADARTKTIPVVMLTSSAEESDIIKSYNLGVNSYIVKPVDFTKFIQSVVDVGLYWLVLNRSPS
jgi:CheY-like chemotaxis protein